jgi:hypothetical protein
VACSPASAPEADPAESRAWPRAYRAAALALSLRAAREPVAAMEESREVEEPLRALERAQRKRV